MLYVEDAKALPANTDLEGTQSNNQTLENLCVQCLEFSLKTEREIERYRPPKLNVSQQPTYMHSRYTNDLLLEGSLEYSESKLENA